jgi:hypothetical protein
MRSNYAAKAISQLRNSRSKHLEHIQQHMPFGTRCAMAQEGL